MEYWCAGQQAEYAKGYIQLPKSRVVWEAANPNMAARATMDHMTGKFKDNQIFNLDDVSKAENICRMIYNKYGFAPMSGKARKTTAAKAWELGLENESLNCWGPFEFRSVVEYQQ